MARKGPTPVGHIIEGIGEQRTTAECGGCGREHEVEPWVLYAFTSKGLAFVCDECGENDRVAAIAEQARRQHADLVAAMRKRAGLPRKWHDVTLDHLDADGERIEAITAAAEWAMGKRRRGILLYGPVGRGKTAIAAGAANGRLGQARAVRWLPVGELLMDLRMPFDSIEYVRAQRALDPGGAALVLDDLDKVRPSEHAREPIYVAVNAWVEAELPLIVTMNRSIDELAEDFGERYGDAIASRLAGYCDIFEVKGNDRRLG